jgi:uncharacterized membrane protein YhaH (DUF805 family)
MITPSLTLSQAVKSVLKENYCNFSGRARRSEYWNFFLFNVILGFILYFVIFIFVALFKDSFIILIPLILFFAFLIYCLIPGLAVMVRRLHDTGRSGLYYFVVFIPFVGEILLLIFLLEDSQPNTNMYGPSNKYVSNNINPILAQGNYLPPQGNIVVQGNVVYPQNYTQGNVVPGQGNIVVPGQGNIVVPPGNIDYTPQINNAYNQNTNV